MKIRNVIVRLFMALFMLLICFFSLSVKAQTQQYKTPKRFSIMGLGDSITEGGETFQCYLFPLWEKLFTAGYGFDFIGPNKSKCRIGTLSNAGYGGKTAEYLDAQIDGIYREYPANIVLLHTGHNHFDIENPVAGIIKAQKSIIRKILKINPGAKILVAQVITSGKLPKYSYLPILNIAIGQMVKELNNRNVLLVDQATGFDWEKHTISDKVHPNTAGGERMAEVWFAGIKKILPRVDQVFSPQQVIYKQLDSGELKLHIFQPKKGKKEQPRSAIIYFFGGGWSLGTPLQFYRECAHYAAKGMVAIAAEYRISYLHKTTPFESFEDAKYAIRWVRAHASEFNIDPTRIAAAGASAGGHLAAAAGIIKEYSSEKNDISSKPNLLILSYPVIDNGLEGYGPEEMKKRFREISPLHNIDSTAPPTLFFLGKKDELIPVKTAEEFKVRMEKAGRECELHLFEGVGHPIFYYTSALTENYFKLLELEDKFLQKHGYFSY
jgi:acetyl esterase/lipase/lysophospholipase L1-like esterase